MRYFTAFLFFWIATAVWAQQPSKVSGIILNDNGMRPLANVNIINVNQVRGTTTDDGGRFEMEIAVNDTLHLSLIGFKSLRIRVTNDWIKNKTATILMTEKAVALEEVVVKRYNLTGYLEIDSKLIPTRENFRYSISGLPHAYEAGEYS
ncbi:MAG TPA: carboxypeptidase-like regulatory domain-containing protein, partial [Flavobacterium sp.]|nr:carboxypeptidase-like regulatory domain-containing protein [Flavobacterium sp.]